MSVDTGVDAPPAVAARFATAVATIGQPAVQPGDRDATTEIAAMAFGATAVAAPGVAEGQHDEATPVADASSGVATTVANPSCSQDPEPMHPVVDRVGRELVLLCITVADEVLEARPPLEGDLGGDDARRQRVLARLEVYRYMAEVIDERQQRLLNAGHGLGLTNAAMATALGLKSGEAVRKRLQRHGGEAPAVAR